VEEREGSLRGRRGRARGVEEDATAKEASRADRSVRSGDGGRVGGRERG
jgi:hypothetical protein